jgi:hypothetical protein
MTGSYSSSMSSFAADIYSHPEISLSSVRIRAAGIAKSVPKSGDLTDCSRGCSPYYPMMYTLAHKSLHCSEMSGIAALSPSHQWANPGSGLWYPHA